MKDQFNREIDYLRISVTDRCNLRCTYCMPEEGVVPIDHKEILTFDEIVRICRIASTLGVSKIKLTGGEPLVRKGLPELVREIREIPGIREVTMTTNGILLTEQMAALYAAGIGRVNVSLDTLDAEEFHHITRWGNLEDVLRGIDEVLKYPSVTLKLNCVPVTVREETILSLVEMARNRKLHVRFIEVMPIGEGTAAEKNAESADPELSGADRESQIKEILTAHYGALKPSDAVLGNGPSHYYEIDGFEGKVGFISAVSHKFCDRCNRIRLTSDGYLKTCLQYDIGCDLKKLMRDGAGDEAVRQAIELAVARKPKEHAFSKAYVEHAEGRCMSRIGG